jgi:hypothetical protein
MVSLFTLPFYVFSFIKSCFIVSKSETSISLLFCLLYISSVDTVVRKAAMALKSGLLVYYKNSRGRNYRRQAQLLTLVEYILLLYRALIPTPVWYRFFLNKEYGNLFSALTTGLYLTFKLTSTLEKVL